MHRDRFFSPRFVARLTDGRLFVNTRRISQGDTAEKENVGKLWAEKSGNLF